MDLNHWNWLEKLWDPSTGLGALGLAVLLTMAAVISSSMLTRIMTRPKWVTGKLARKVDETVVRYFVRVKTLLIFLTAGLIYASLIPSLRALMGTMIAGAGITAIVVGFAAKSTLANLISGLTLAIYRPIRIGDKVTVDGEYGAVEDITMRHTVVRTWENLMLIIPNEKLDNMSITNYNIIDPTILCRLEIGVSYDTDLDLAKRLLIEEAMRCPHRDEAAPEPWVRVVDHSDFSIEMRIYMWVKDVDVYWLGKFWLLEHIKKRFDREGVEIPFPYRTVVYKKDLPPAPRDTLK